MYVLCHVIHFLLEGHPLSDSKRFVKKLSTRVRWKLCLITLSRNCNWVLGETEWKADSYQHEKGDIYCRILPILVSGLTKTCPKHTNFDCVSFVRQNRIYNLPTLNIEILPFDCTLSTALTFTSAPAAWCMLKYVHNQLQIFPNSLCKHAAPQGGGERFLFPLIYGETCHVWNRDVFYATARCDMFPTSSPLGKVKFRHLITTVLQGICIFFPLSDNPVHSGIRWHSAYNLVWQTHRCILCYIGNLFLRITCSKILLEVFTFSKPFFVLIICFLHWATSSQHTKRSAKRWMRSTWKRNSVKSGLDEVSWEEREHGNTYMHDRLMSIEKRKKKQFFWNKTCKMATKGTREFKENLLQLMKTLSLSGFWSNFNPDWCTSCIHKCFSWTDFLWPPKYLDRNVKHFQTIKMLFRRAFWDQASRWRFNSNSGRSTWYDGGSQPRLSSSACGGATLPTRTPCPWPRGSRTQNPAEVPQRKFNCCGILTKSLPSVAAQGVESSVRCRLWCPCLNPLCVFVSPLQGETPTKTFLLGDIVPRPIPGRPGSPSLSYQQFTLLVHTN